MSELKPEELEHIAYMQTLEIQKLTARIAELEAENDRLQSGWFRDETICPDGSLRPKVSDLLNRIAELEAAQRWIPVSERLPLLRDSKAVLVYTKSGETYSGLYLGNNEWTGLLHDFREGEVTHWMPLPTQPEVQE